MAEKSDWDNFKESFSDFVDSITGRSSSNREDGAGNARRIDWLQ